MWSQLGRTTGVSFTTIIAMEQRGLVVLTQLTQHAETLDWLIEAVPAEDWAREAARVADANQAKQMWTRATVTRPKVMRARPLPNPTHYPPPTIH